MLRLPAFDYRRPGSISEAAAILADQGPAARVVAGGTDLWPNMKRRHQRAETVVGLMSIPELRTMDTGGDAREFRIGATATLTEVASNLELQQRYPALVRAVNSISSPPLRNMGTLGGNLCLDTRCTYYNQTEGWRRSIDYCMKEEGTVCWVAPSSPRCWAHSASDSAPMLCALGARLHLQSSRGDRTLGVTELFRDDGIDYLDKRPDELLTTVELPAESSAEKCRSSFWKLRRRGSIDFAVLSVAATVWFDANRHVDRAALFLGAVRSYPVPVPEAGRILQGQPLTEELILQVARAARKVATPMDNTDFKAQWRGAMVERYTQAALREVAGLEPGIMPPSHLL
jgi:4-hydroxybenzoyl-CoA reductase subunit beta